MYSMSEEENRELGKKGSEHVHKNYNFKDFENKWIELMDDIQKNLGSWDTRKDYKAWEVKEIA